MKPHIEVQCRKHAENLARIFPAVKDAEPLRLCRRLRSLERELHAAAEAWCKGEVSDAYWDIRCAATTRALAVVLGKHSVPGVCLWLNGDPRGYALKLDNIPADVPLHRDMGGYGILAPEFV